MKKKFVRTILFLLSISCAPSAFAVLDWDEVNIPMTDNMSLAGDVYLPAGWIDGPVILIQTPYNKNVYHLTGLPIGIGMAQETMQYAIVIVDWRGFYGSATALYAGAPSLGLDGYDVVEWIASQSWCNGKVGTWGPSALGRVQYQTARQQPPHLVCMVPQVASPLQNYLDYYPNGAARTEYLEQLDALGFGTSPVVYAHPYLDLTWNVSEASTNYPQQITIPTLMIGGWYDHNVETMVQFFSSIQNLSAFEVREQHRLLIGPWAHGGSGVAALGTSTQGQLSYPAAAGWSNSQSFQFFDYHLKGFENGWDATAKVRYFQMGDNTWQNADSWPVSAANNTKLFFHNDGIMRAELPQEITGMELNYDPSDPCPTIGGPTLRTDLDQGPYDQTALVESREDVLVMTSGVLANDVVLKGAAKVQVTLSTDVTDTDVCVRLCDVYPDGRSMLVSDGVYRLRFLNGFTEASLISLAPSTDYSAVIKFSHTAITFKAGHRIRVDVSGSNYPRFNRNMNTGGEMYPNLNGDSLINPLIAHNVIKLSTTSSDGSFLELPLQNEILINNILESDDNEGMEIYPVPAIDVLNVIVTENNLLSGNLMITNQLGSVLVEEKLSSARHQLNISAFAEGQYFITVTNGKNSIVKAFSVLKK